MHYVYSIQDICLFGFIRERSTDSAGRLERLIAPMSRSFDVRLPLHIAGTVGDLVTLGRLLVRETRDLAVAEGVYEEAVVVAGDL